MAEVIRRRRRRDSGLKFRTKMVPMEVAICPKCGKDMKKEFVNEPAPLYHWKCPDCGYKH